MGLYRLILFFFALHHHNLRLLKYFRLLTIAAANRRGRNHRAECEEVTSGEGRTRASASVAAKPRTDKRPDSVLSSFHLPLLVKQVLHCGLETDHLKKNKPWRLLPQHSRSTCWWRKEGGGGEKPTKNKTTLARWGIFNTAERRGKYLRVHGQNLRPPLLRLPPSDEHKT